MRPLSRERIEGAPCSSVPSREDSKATQHQAISKIYLYLYLYLRIYLLIRVSLAPIEKLLQSCITPRPRPCLGPLSNIALYWAPPKNDIFLLTFEYINELNFLIFCDVFNREKEERASLFERGIVSSSTTPAIMLSPNPLSFPSSFPSF